MGDSAWVFEGADVSVTDGELVFGNIPGAGNPWEVQAHQFFTSGTDGINNKDSIYVGPYQVSFDARTTTGTQELHLFLGEVGGGWARYLSPDAGGNGRFTVDTEMKTDTVGFGVDRFETMRIGFEVVPQQMLKVTVVDNTTTSRCSTRCPSATLALRWNLVTVADNMQLPTMFILLIQHY